VVLLPPGVQGSLFGLFPEVDPIVPDGDSFPDSEDE
jgi:hypothetical protein